MWVTSHSTRRCCCHLGYQLMVENCCSRSSCRRDTGMSCSYLIYIRNISSRNFPCWHKLLSPYLRMIYGSKHHTFHTQRPGETNLLQAGIQHMGTWAGQLGPGLIQYHLPVATIYMKLTANLQGGLGYIKSLWSLYIKKVYGACTMQHPHATPNTPHPTPPHPLSSPLAIII